MHICFQAQEFIDESGIDALAVCIGNVHGKYPSSGPNLRLDLLKVRYLYSCFSGCYTSKQTSNMPTVFCTCNAHEKKHEGWLCAQSDSRFTNIPFLTSRISFSNRGRELN